MKNLKRVAFGAALAIAMSLGVATSTVTTTEKAQALQEISPTSVPCWSAGTAPLISFRRYVECASCKSVKGKPTGGAGNCTP